MAKHARKVAAALKARQDAHSDTMPQSGQRCTMPGSQNVKKTGKNPAPKG